MSNNGICVGVTALKTVESPQPGFGVARALKNRGFKVIGIDDTPLTSAIVAPYFDSVYVINSLKTENFEEFRKNLIKIKKKECLDVLIPCYDKDVFFFVKYQKQIEELGIKLLLPTLGNLRLTSKPFLSTLTKFGVLTPKTIIVTDKKGLKTASEELGFPLVCKGVIKDAYIAKDLADTFIYFDRIREIWHGGKGNVILQEFIAGEFYCIAGVTDYKKTIIRQLQMKKLGIDSKGTTWSGFTIKDKRLVKLTKQVIHSVQWVGPFELEFIKDYKTDRFYLFEVNPRLPSWIHLATIAGQNMAEAIVKIALNKVIEPKFTYKNNLMFTRLAEEIIYPMNYSKKRGNIKVMKPLKNNNGGIVL